MNCNPNLRALAIQHTAIAALAEQRPTLTMANAKEALEFFATAAASCEPERGTIPERALAIYVEALVNEKIPPFD